MRKKIWGLLACVMALTLCVTILPNTIGAQAERETPYVAQSAAGEITYGKTLYSQDFSAIDKAGDFTVKDGKAVSEDNKFKAFELPVSEFTDDFELSVEAEFPVDKDAFRDSFVAFNLRGMTAAEVENNAFECSVHAYAAPDAFVNDHANGKILYLYSGGNGAKLVKGETATIVIRRIGVRIFIIVNDVVAVKGDLPAAATLKPTSMNMFVAGDAVGTKIDNLVLKEIIPSTQINEVTVKADKTTVSTAQSAILTAEYQPDTAKASYKWYVNDVQAENQSTATYSFTSKTPGSYAVKCAVNDVMSPPVTVTVTEASDEEKDALYFENFNTFDNGIEAGGFTVQDGKAVSKGDAYSRYDFAFDKVMNFDAKMKVTFNDTTRKEAFGGFTVGGLDESGCEVEFNFHRMPEAASDYAVIKYNGNEKYFSNNPDKGGRLTDFAGFETGVAYTLRVVRYGDQLEMYVNDEIAVKIYLADPAVPSTTFMFSIAGSVTFDDVVIKASQEITDRVEPPHVDVTSAHVTASNISPKAGEKTTLTVQCAPFDATPTTYQWYVNGEAIEGATSATYEFSSDTAGDYAFTCVVDGTITSEAKTITVKAATPAEDGKKGCGGMLAIGNIGIALGVLALCFIGMTLVSKRNEKRS